MLIEPLTVAAPRSGPAFRQTEVYDVGLEGFGLSGYYLLHWARI